MVLYMEETDFLFPNADLTGNITSFALYVFAKSLIV